MTRTIYSRAAYLLAALAFASVSFAQFVPGHQKAPSDPPLPDPVWKPVTDKDRTEGRRVNLTYRWRGEPYGYPAVMPPDYFNGRKPENGFPLIVELGGGDGGYGHPLDDIGIGCRSLPPKRGYFVAVPIATDRRGFNREVERAVIPVIRDMCDRFPIDEQNVFLVGYSNGANGTYRLLYLFPERFAAAAAASGAPKARWASRIMKTPLLIFHHSGDPIINVKYNRELVRNLRRLGAKDGVDFAYREQPGEGHVGMAYMHEELTDWFDHFRRPLTRDEQNDLKWATKTYPWLRRQIPVQPKSERERRVAETIINDYEGTDYTNAAKLYTAAVECEIQTGDPWYALGVMLFDQEEYEKSIDAFKRCIQLNGENPRDERVATAYLWIGHDLDLLGRRADAVRWYTKARDTGNEVEIGYRKYGIFGSAKSLGAQRIQEPFQRYDKKTKTGERNSAGLTSK